MVKILSQVLDSSQIERVTQGTKEPQLHTRTSPSLGCWEDKQQIARYPVMMAVQMGTQMDMQVSRLTEESSQFCRRDVFPNQPTLLHLIPLPLVKILIYTPKLFPPPSPGSGIQSLHTLVDSYCPLRCHLAKLYIYLQATLLIFSHKSVPPVV